jgi:catechol 2,3-dioxygenase-like lactoylglutathione lyase family enzyme
MPGDELPSDFRGQEAFRNFVQIGVVVQDLDRTVKFLSEVLGLGPFRYTTYPPDRDDMWTAYRGEPGAFTHRIAFADLGPVELEIVQPLTGASALTEFLDEHGEGIQHLRFNVDAVEPVIDYLAGQGIEPLMSGTGLRPGTTWVHFDTADQVGFVVEVMNPLPGTDGRTPKQLES